MKTGEKRISHILRTYKITNGTPANFINFFVIENAKKNKHKKSKRNIFIGFNCNAYAVGAHNEYIIIVFRLMTLNILLNEKAKQ